MTEVTDLKKQVMPLNVTGSLKIERLLKDMK